MSDQEGSKLIMVITVVCKEIVKTSSKTPP